MTISHGQERELSGGAERGLVPGKYAPPASLRPTLTGDRWAVVAGHPVVTQVAAEVLSAGGNAVDAGVAAGLATNVVQVDMANFGGIAPVLVRPGGGSDVFSIAGVGRWGRAADLAQIRARHGGALPLGGVPSVVPAAPAAWVAALTRFGTWSFRDVVAPAIELARDGFPLDPRTAESLGVMGGGFAQWPTSRQVYWPGGSPLLPGQRLVQPRLADLLRELADAERGATRVEALRSVHERFYTGAVARRIVEFVVERGGCLAESDLASFEAEVQSAPARRIGEWDVHVTPSWSQGPVLTTALGILQGFALPSLAHNGSRYLHLLAEAFGLAFSDRELHLGDPDFMRVELEHLQSDERLAALRGLIGDRALPPLASAHVPVPLRSTTSVVVTDASGATFAAAPSDTLDGAPIIPELGIVCSPRGVQSRLVDGHPNAVAPGKRPCVTPVTAIALRHGPHGEGHLDSWALSCPGGDVIVQAIAQAFLNVTVFQQTLQEAVESARVAYFNAPSAFHPHREARNVLYAEDRVPDAVRADLVSAGHDVRVWPAYEFDAGSVQMTMRTHGPDGGVLVLAGADPRRTAYGMVR